MAIQTARQIAADVRSGRRSARSVVEAALARAATVQSDTNAFYRLDDRALAASDAIDAKLAAGTDPGPLAGVPVAIKDNIVERDRPCTCGSRILDGYVGSYDAHAIGLLKAAGAIVIGRTNMDEFGMGSSTEHCAWGVVRHPHDRERVPGGSSGGSAVAVAARVTPVALGSDTGGSVRQPAAFCGIVGLKPTYGRVSRRGLVAFGSSLDQIGPLGGDVRDTALLASAIAGPDLGDATSANEPVGGWLAACDHPIHGLRIGVPRQYFAEGLDAGVRLQVTGALDRLRSAGAELVEISLPSSALAVACYYVIAPAEASSNLARFDGVRYGFHAPGRTVADMQELTRSEGFGREVKRRILIGTWVLSAGYVDAYYHKAQRVRALIAAELDTALSSVDALVSPTTPTTAFRLGSVTDPVAMYLSDVYTVPPSLAGLPAISVPCGVANGLPVGLQIIGRRFDEATCFRIAAAVEATAVR